ncbi:zinc finger, CCHC-type containing protein [Tanacetum coccineum]
MFRNLFSSTTIGDENPIRTLGDYSKPSHEGYRDTIELPVGNNVVPLRSDTIRLVQNKCSFHEIRSDDQNQHLKDFLKLVDSLDLDGSITTLEDLTTRFLAQFFLPGRTAKLRNDILMFQHIMENLYQKHGLISRTYYKSPSSWHRSLLKELTTRRAPEKVLIREEAKSPVTKSINSISLIREEEGKNDIYDVATGDDSKETDRPDMEMLIKDAETKNRAESGAKNKPIKKPKKEEVVEAPSSQPVEYYLKHKINEKLIEGLVDNNRFNDSLLGARVGKKRGKTYNVLPRGPVYKAILKKKVTKKENIGENFEIPYSIGGLKTPAKTDIRLSLASHSYIYPLGIAEDVVVEIVKHVYPVDFVILDIKEDEKRPFILGTPFLTMAKVVIKFNKGNITLRPEKSKISFHRIPESPKWEERIRLHQEKEIEFDRWRSKNFKNEHLALTKVEGGIDNEGEVTLYLIRRSMEVLRRFHWMILGGQFNQYLAFGGNTCDLGLFREEMDETTDLHQHLLRLCSQRLETASQDIRDAVTNHPTMVSQEFMTASARTTQPRI